MSSFKLKKLTKQLSIPVLITIVTFLMVMTHRITKVNMESSFSSLEQRMDSERVIYEQRIGSLVDRLATVMANPDPTNTAIDVTASLDELFAQAIAMGTQRENLNTILYDKLIHLYPESAAHFLMTQFQGKHSEWAYRFMLDYVTDQHLAYTCSLTLENIQESTTDPQLRHKATILLKHFSQFTQE